MPGFIALALDARASADARALAADAGPGRGPAGPVRGPAGLQDRSADRCLSLQVAAIFFAQPASEAFVLAPTFPGAAHRLFRSAHDRRRSRGSPVPVMSFPTLRGRNVDGA